MSTSSDSISSDCELDVGAKQGINECSGKLDHNDSREKLGPSLPPGYQKQSLDMSHRSLTEGPRLPPGFTKEGPALPPGYRKEGPSLPPGHRRGSQQLGSQYGTDILEQDLIGPMPVNQEGETSQHDVAQDFERRAENMRRNLAEQNAVAKPKRESWMTELPESGARLGLTSRKLTGGGAVEQDGTWADTPSDRERKRKAPSSQTDRIDLEQRAISQRDEKLEKEIKTHNDKYRKESLLTMHKKKKKKEKKKKEKKKKDKEKEKSKRVPFDRDKDLKLNFMDDDKKKAFIERSSQLTSRFGHGTQKFI